MKAKIAAIGIVCPMLFAAPAVLGQDLASACVAQCANDFSQVEYCKEVCAGAQTAEQRDAVEWSCVVERMTKGENARSSAQQCPKVFSPNDP